MTTVSQLFNYNSYSTNTRATSSTLLSRAGKSDSPLREVVEGDSVSLSSTGKNLAAMQGLGLASMLGSLTVKEDEHLEKAGKLLQAKAEESGLAISEPFTLVCGDNGEVEVSPADHAQREAIEQILKENPDIASHIRGASQSAVMTRIAEAATKVAQAAAADPANLEAYYARLSTYGEALSKYDYVATFKDGGLSGGFRDSDGKAAVLPEFSLAG